MPTVQAEERPIAGTRGSASDYNKGFKEQTEGGGISRNVKSEESERVPHTVACPRVPSTRHGHEVVFRWTRPAAHHEPVLTVQCGQSRTGRGRLGFVQDADGAVLANPVRHFIRVNPKCELSGEQGEEPLRIQAHPTGRPADQRVHLMVDPDAAVTRTLLRPVREPVVPVTIWGRKKNNQGSER